MVLNCAQPRMCAIEPVGLNATTAARLIKVTIWKGGLEGVCGGGEQRDKLILDI